MVGATDYQKNIAEMTSTISFNTTKPTLVAPGSNLSNISSDCPYLDGYRNENNEIIWLPTNSGTLLAKNVSENIYVKIMEYFLIKKSPFLSVIMDKKRRF